MERTIKLGKDDPRQWANEARDLGRALGGKPSKYWHRVSYPKPVAKEEVKALRVSLHLTQLGLARALGTSLSTIRSWEQGTKKPDGLARKVLRSIIEKPKLLDQLARA